MFSIVSVLTVLNIYGILCFWAAFAKIAGELGHIKPYNPIAETPNGASYVSPSIFVVESAPGNCLKYYGTSSV